MTHSASSSNSDAQINRLLLSDDLANVRLGLHLALNPVITLEDLSCLMGLALLEHHEDIAEMAKEILVLRLIRPSEEKVRDLWQPTHAQGSAKHLFKALAGLEKAFGFRKGSMQVMAVQKLDRFPDMVAHNYPLAFRQWCVQHLQDGLLSFKGVEMPVLPLAILKVEGIRQLDLRGCGLEFVPEHIGKLNAVETLYLEQRGLAELPGSLPRLSNLRAIHLHGKRFRRISPVLKELEGLRELHVVNGAKDCMTGLTEITQLEKVVYIDSPFQFLPGIGAMQALRHLEVRNEANGWQIPGTIGECRDLEHLKLAQQSDFQLPSTLSSLKKLRTLEIRPINPKQEFPSLKGFDVLEEMSISSRALFDFPDSWCALPALHTLLLDTVMVDLPAEFAHMTHLRRLELTNTVFGAVPIPISKLVRLETLVLHGHRFAGGHMEQLDLDLSELKQLQSIKLTNLGLKDVPRTLFEMPWLQVINLADNHIPVPRVNALRECLPNTRIVMH